MKFVELLEYESIHPGSAFHRVDPRRGWYIKFDPATGRLSQAVKEPHRQTSVSLYHHDFVDGEWEVYTK